MHAADWGVMALYAAAVLAIGWRSGRGHQTAGDFFVGGRSMPVWAVLFSMVATELSAATFIGVPHAGYLGDWSYIQLAFGALAAKLLLAGWWIRLYHQEGLVTVYGLIDRRFGRRSHLCSAWFFLLGRVLASGARLFLAGLAFSTVTGLSVPAAIVVAGIVATLYTMAGGIRAVIWTDTLQGFVFLTAALVSVGVVASGLEGGLPGLLERASASGKLEVFHLPPLLVAGPGAEETWGFLARLWEGFRVNYLASDSSLVLAIVGAFFLNLATSGTDQDMVQRLLTTRDGRGGGRALWISGVTNFPLSALFLLVGTALWAWYQANPDPGYSIADDKRIFPLFVLHEMPAGLRGFIFAGLFAAAMSSLDSAMNALATTWTVDIRGHGDREAPMGSVKLTTVAFALALMGAALLFVPYYETVAQASPDIDLVRFALSAMMIVYGGLLGAFLVARLTPGRGTDGSVLTGMLCGAVCGLLLFLQPVVLGETPVCWLWWIIIGAVVSFGIGASRPARSGP